MKRLMQLSVLIAVLLIVADRLVPSLRVGAVVLDERELAAHESDPLKLTVVGIVTIPTNTPADLVKSAIRTIRVVGILKADQNAMTALSGKATYVVNVVDDDAAHSPS